MIMHFKLEHYTNNSQLITFIKIFKVILVLKKATLTQVNRDLVFGP